MIIDTILKNVQGTKTKAFKLLKASKVNFTWKKTDGDYENVSGNMDWFDIKTHVHPIIHNTSTFEGKTANVLIHIEFIFSNLFLSNYCFLVKKLYAPTNKIIHSSSC